MTGPGPAPAGVGNPGSQGVPAARRSPPPLPGLATPPAGSSRSQDAGGGWRKPEGGAWPGGAGQRKSRSRPSPDPPPPTPADPRPARRRRTGLMGIQVLARHVVVNHIFFQGGESEPVDWERTERTGALRRLWRLGGGGCRADSRTAPAGRSLPPPRSLTAPPAARARPLGSPCRRFSQDSVPLPLPAPQPCEASSQRRPQTPT